MHSELLKTGPLRQPAWRLARVVEMVSHRPRPLPVTGGDDSYVRAYRRVLLALVDAGDDQTKQEQIFEERPDVCHAHQFYHSFDIERRAILEARLLTNQTIEEIAVRFGMAPQVIHYYAKLFFDVRGRLQCSDWIRSVIVGPRSAYRHHATGVMTDEERGYVYRLFAYFGGPLALDAVVSGMLPAAMPARAEDVRGWFDNTLNQNVRSSAAAAVATLRSNQQNMMQTITLAIRTSAKKPATRETAPNLNLEAIAEKVLASLGRGPTDRTAPEPAENPSS